MATRAAGKVLQALAPAVPELVGGSADLAPSTSTLMKEYGSVEAGSYGGRNFHWGIREHGMTAILNGILCHGGLRPFGATFLVFSDYMRPAIRLAAIMGAPAIYVWTHDSVWLGEDGPTHQPIEHLMALRLIPNLVTFRPCDAKTTAWGWRRDRAHRRPDRASADAAGPAHAGRHGRRRRDARRLRAGRRRRRPRRDRDRVGLGGARCARGARDAAGRGHRRTCRIDAVVGSLRHADIAYREQVLPPAVTTRVSIEAGVTAGWERWLGERGRAVGIDRFGASAPGKVVARNLGISPEAVVDAVKAVRHG